MKRTGKRFDSSFWTERLAPVLLVLLVVVMLAVLVITVLSVLGLTPGF
jgi:hypothetical protein